LSRPYQVLLIAALAYVSPVIGQEPRATCVYDECSLRLEGTRIVRGRTQQAGRVGLLSAVSIVPLIVPSSDSGLAYASTFDHIYSRAARVTFIGTLLTAAGGAILAKERSVGVAVPILATGGIAALWGLPKLRRADEALSRAIWWNNREIGRIK
jgi:hypothetical protein